MINIICVARWNDRIINSVVMVMIIDTLTCFKFDFDINSCQFSYEVAEHIGHRDDVNLTTVFTQTTFPLWLDM